MKENAVNYGSILNTATNNDILTGSIHQSSPSKKKLNENMIMKHECIIIIVSLVERVKYLILSQSRGADVFVGLFWCII